MRLSAPDGAILISADGPGLTYLGRTDPSTDERSKWTHNLRFVRIESNLVVTKVIIEQIKGLMAIARNRYIEPTRVSVMQLEPSMLREWLALGGGGGVPGVNMSMTLAYYDDDDDAQPGLGRGSEGKPS